MRPQYEESGIPLSERAAPAILLSTFTPYDTRPRVAEATKRVDASRSMFWFRPNLQTMISLYRTTSAAFRINLLPRQRGAASCPLMAREMRDTLQSRLGPARPDWLQLGPLTGSILPFGHRAGNHKAAGTCSLVNDRQCLAADQALSDLRHGTTRIGLFCRAHLSSPVPHLC